MLKDQPFNQVNIDPPDIVKPASDTMQDGMLAYYQSQALLTETYENNVIAHQYFDCRDMLGTKKK